MRVGVFFPGFPSYAGGGYTFEHEILTSLVELAGESRHQFTLFLCEPFLAELIPPENKLFKIVVLNKAQQIDSSSSTITRQVFDRFLGKPGRKVEDSRSKQEFLFQQEVKKAKIDFLWYPTVDTIPAEIPYLATIWDIQHRLQPWFPEVSNDGEWEHREAYFSKHLRRASYVVTGNHAGQQELSFFYQIPPERFRLIPHPTPRVEPVTGEEVRDVLSKYSISPGYLFYPAQFWAHKNHANLLLALQILRDQYQKKMQLILVGSDHGNKDYIYELAEQLKVVEQLHFLGFVPRNELTALYRGAFALIYPTYFGPENLPPLEAFSLGCPVIASSVHGAEEQLGEAALLFDPSSAEQIAQRIHQLSVDDSLRERLVRAGRERANKWTSRNFVREIFTILDEFEKVRKCWPAK